LLDMLHNCDGPMPIDWIKSHYRASIPRLRELGLLYKRDKEWVQITKLGRSVVGQQAEGS
jgi:hypothetical protein